MEPCENDHLNESTSNSEEKQSDSFNSSELDDAMNDLLTQDIQESLNNSSVANEEDLLDMMEEKPASKHSIQKLKFHTAKRIIRRAKKLPKKNYYFFNRSASTSSTMNISTKERTNIELKTSETLNKLDEKTSQKIKKVVNSGDLSIQRFKSLETRHSIPSKPKFILAYESDQISLPPESFPKAIVYPKTKKINVQSRAEEKLSFYDCFTKTTEEQIKMQKTLHPNQITKEEVVSKENFTNKTKPRVLPSKSKESSKIKSLDDENESIETEPFKYLIPQNLLAAQNDKSCASSDKNDSNASTSISQRNSVSSDENQEYTHAVIPERPQINYDLIDTLADYRVIARYLFNKLNVPPIDFDGTDDYINLYKLSRN